MIHKYSLLVVFSVFTGMCLGMPKGRGVKKGVNSAVCREDDFDAQLREANREAEAHYAREDSNAQRALLHKIGCDDKNSAYDRLQWLKNAYDLQWQFHAAAVACFGATLKAATHFLHLWRKHAPEYWKFVNDQWVLSASVVLSNCSDTERFIFNLLVSKYAKNFDKVDTFIRDIADEDVLVLRRVVRCSAVSKAGRVFSELLIDNHNLAEYDRSVIACDARFDELSHSAMSMMEQADTYKHVYYKEFMRCMGDLIQCMRRSMTTMQNVKYYTQEDVSILENILSICGAWEKSLRSYSSDMIIVDQLLDNGLQVAEQLVRRPRRALASACAAASSSAPCAQVVIPDVVAAENEPLVQEDDVVSNSAIDIARDANRWLPRVALWLGSPDDQHKALQIKIKETKLQYSGAFRSLVCHHAFDRAVDQFLPELGIVVPWKNKHVVSINIPGELQYDDGRVERGVFSWGVDKERKVCFHRSFAKRVIDDIRELVKAHIYDIDFPSLDVSAHACSESMQNAVTSLVTDNGLWVEIRDVLNNMTIRLYKIRR